MMVQLKWNTGPIHTRKCDPWPALFCLRVTIYDIVSNNTQNTSIIINVMTTLKLHGLSFSLSQYHNFFHTNQLS